MVIACLCVTAFFFIEYPFQLLITISAVYAPLFYEPIGLICYTQGSRFLLIVGKHDHKLSITSDFSMRSPNLIEFIRPISHWYSPPVDPPAKWGIFLLIPAEQADLRSVSTCV